MSEIKRWHDKSQKLADMMRVLNNMSDKELDEIAKYLYQVVNIYRKQRKSQDDGLSIGRDKLFGYYKAYQKRRWYDRNPSLSSAVNILSILPPREVDSIINGFIDALKKSGLYDIYHQKQKQVKE